ncbi:DUF3833 domain-containing protein [Gymnodinialimonas sp.]
MIRRLLILCALVALAACGRPSLTDPTLSGRDLNLEEFFHGNLSAYGQFQDVFGEVRRRFEVDIRGTWDGQTLRLVEDFRYDDGSTEQRIWSLQQTGNGGWQGTAPGVIGVATGQEVGDTFNWQYTIDLPLPDRDPLRVTFDDWMWMLSEDRVLNRAYMSRLGVPIGEVIITFERD